MPHDPLWAPWRLSYVKQPADSGADRDASCFLCDYVQAASSADAARHVVHRTDSLLIVLNRYPYNNGHLLVAPQAHKACLTDLTESEMLEQVQWMQRMTAALSNVLNPDGFNVGLNLGRVAGAGLPGHLHWHIVPRWNGDTNFMPVVGETGVIPQSLEALHTLLVDELARSAESP